MTSFPKPQSKMFFNRNSTLLSCLFIWFAVNVLQYAYLGIRTGGDTGRYTGAAINILNGEWPDGKAIEYMGYNIFVAFSQLVNSSFLFETIVAIQVLMSAVALICLFKTAETYGGKIVAVFASMAWVLFPDTQYWNFLILTESLFVSFGLISLYAVLHAKTRLSIAGAAIFVIFTATIRPNGLIILVGAYTYFLIDSIIKRHYLFTTVMLVFGLLAMMFGANLLGGIAERQEIIGSFIKGEIIWGYPPSYNPLPETSYLTGNLNNLSVLFQFILTEPVYFLDVVFTKIFYLLSHTRPYWSGYHNLYALLFLMPIYSMVITNLYWSTVPLEIASFTYPWIATQFFVVAFSFADWDGRHLLPIYPLFCLLAGFCFKRLCNAFSASRDGP